MKSKKKDKLQILKKRYESFSDLITDSECKVKIALNFLVSETNFSIKEQYVFIRQGKDLSYYIADFYLPWAKVVVEVDGGVHDHQQNYDTKRDIDILNDYGVITLRIKNEDVDSKEKMNELMYSIMSGYSKVSRNMARCSKTVTRLYNKLVDRELIPNDSENINNLFDKAEEEILKVFIHDDDLSVINYYDKLQSNKNIFLGGYKRFFNEKSKEA